MKEVVEILNGDRERRSKNNFRIGFTLEAAIKKQSSYRVLPTG